MRLLGIDFGRKRIGIALSDDKGMMAFPHSVIANNKEAEQAILWLAKSNGISSVVIGESKDYSGVENPIMKEARAFADGLVAAGLKVEFESELLSSHQAAHFQGKTAMIDAAAASIILQSYIDRKNHARSN